MEGLWNPRNNKPKVCFLISACTTNGGAEPDLPCVFPFSFFFWDFFTCTIFGSSEGLWCSTEVSDSLNRFHKIGHWGYCGPDCFRYGVTKLNGSNKQIEALTVLAYQCYPYFKSSCLNPQCPMFKCVVWYFLQITFIKRKALVTSSFRPLLMCLYS